jgi:outer membrane protein OmpA-like peptidoglycan-associated protein
MTARAAQQARTSRFEVVAPPRKEYSFEDVHFDFDRFNLRPDALKILDDAVAPMQANADLRLTIEGHTCNIGTTDTTWRSARSAPGPCVTT